MTKPNQYTADRAYLADLRRGFECDYPPQTAAEQVLLNELIGAAQRLYHLNRIEEDHCAGTPDLDTLGKISRQRTAADRIFHRSLRCLEKAKAQRLSKLPNEPNPVCDTNKPNPAPEPNKANLAPSRTEIRTTGPTSTPEPYSSSQPFNTIHHPSPVCDNVETPADPLKALIESYRAAQPDNPAAAYRCQKAAAHLHKFRPLGSPAQLRREIIAILQPPPE